MCLIFFVLLQLLCFFSISIPLPPITNEFIHSINQSFVPSYKFKASDFLKHPGFSILPSSTRWLYLPPLRFKNNFRNFFRRYLKKAQFAFFRLHPYLVYLVALLRIPHARTVLYRYQLPFVIWVLYPHTSFPYLKKKRGGFPVIDNLPCVP